MMKSQVAHKVAYTTKLKRKLVDRETAPLSLSRSQWQTLAWLNNFGVPCSQKALLEATEFDKGQLTRVLDTLDKRGFVKRKNPADNRRSIEIHVSSAGKKMLTKIDLIMQQELKIMLAKFTNDEKKFLESLLDRLISNLSNALNEPHSDWKSEVSYCD